MKRSQQGPGAKRLAFSFLGMPINGLFLTHELFGRN